MIKIRLGCFRRKRTLYLNRGDKICDTVKNPHLHLRSWLHLLSSHLYFGGVVHHEERRRLTGEMPTDEAVEVTCAFNLVRASRCSGWIICWGVEAGGRRLLLSAVETRYENRSEQDLLTDDDSLINNQIQIVWDGGYGYAQCVHGHKWRWRRSCIYWDVSLIGAPIRDRDPEKNWKKHSKIHPIHPGIRYR